jgi:hypothetical protein
MGKDIYDKQLLEKYGVKFSSDIDIARINLSEDALQRDILKIFEELIFVDRMLVAHEMRSPTHDEQEAHKTVTGGYHGCQDRSVYTAHITKPKKPLIAQDFQPVFFNYRTVEAPEEEIGRHIRLGWTLIQKNPQKERHYFITN